MPALERIHGWRVVAAGDALDSAAWLGDDVVVLRFAPDEAFGLGAGGVEIDDPDAIQEVEHGFVGVWLTSRELHGAVAHLEWALPTERPALAQGAIAGIPAKLWLPAADPGIVQLDGIEALLLTHAAYADDLAERLGWRS